MSIEAYAQFGLAVGFQQTIGLLMDLGFTSTIIPLVGDQGDNKELVVKYVRAESTCAIAPSGYFRRSR
jgi:hypothetical protein